MSGNCNFMTAPAAASQNYAAINGAQWDSTKNCGRCAEVSCADSRCKDTTTTEIVYILDQCPECKQGDLDVSLSVFKKVTGNEPGRYKIKWKFIDCPVTGNLKYCLKTGSNGFWAAVQPANAAAGIKTVTINSKATTMVPSAYYYLLEGQINLSSVKVSVTSLSGETVTDTVSLTAGQCTTGKSQFSVSGSAPSSPAVTPAPDAPEPSTAPSPATRPPSRPTPPTRRPTRPAPTPRGQAGMPSTPSPPRSESTNAPNASPDGDNGADNDAPAVSPVTPAPTTSAPATTAPTTAAPRAPMTPSTPQPSKKGSCRRTKK
jgi:expansin